MTKPLRIIFMGTPDFAAAALADLIKSDHDIVAVYSQPPRPKGRGHKVQLSPVHALAEENHIPVYTPKSLKGAEAQEEFAALDADIAIVAAYGLILPKAILDAPKHGCLNIHGSILPRWRGASPIQRAIWSGDEISGITIMQMDEGLDTGDMLLKEEVQLDGEMTSSTLHDALAEMGGRMTLDVLDTLMRDGKLTGEKQDEALVTYAHLLKKSDGIIDWNQSADEIDQQIRALNPWPGVWTSFNDKRMKILKAKPVIQSHNLPVGSVIDKTGAVACGGGTTLQLITIQPEGKKAMDVASAFNGGYIEIDKAFS